MPTYRTILFIPSHSHEARIPVGALVQLADGTLQLIDNVYLCRHCVGGQRGMAVIEIALGDIKAEPSLERLPDGVGPQILLGERYMVPASMDPLEWVRGRLIPHDGEE